MAWEPPELKSQASWSPPELQEESSPWASFVQGAKGTAAGVADLASGIVKMPVAVGAAALASAGGARPDLARQEAQESVERWLPSAGHSFGLDQNQAYKAMMFPFEKLAEGIDWVGNKVSDDPSVQGATKQGLDIATFLIPGLGKKGYEMLTRDNKLKDPTVHGDEPTMGKQPAMRPDMGDVDVPVEGIKIEEGWKEYPNAKWEKAPQEPWVPPEVRAAGGRTEPNIVEIPDIQGRIDPLMEDPMITMKRAMEDKAAATPVDPYGTPWEKQQPYEYNDPFEFKPMAEQLASIEKQSAQGPMRENSHWIKQDDILQDPAKNKGIIQDPNLQPGIDFEPSILRGKPLEEAILNQLRAEREKTVAAKTHHPMGKDQAGAINLKDIKDGFSILKQRLGMARDAMMDTPPGMTGRNEGFGDTLKRGVDEFKATGEPAAIRRINRGPGGKQSGAIDPSIFSDDAKKFRDKLNTLLEEYYKLRDVVTGPAKFNLEKHPNKERLTVLKTQIDEVGKELIKFRGKEQKRSEDIQAQGGTGKVLPINKGPGGKQSGAVMSPQEMLDTIRKGSKNVEEFTKKLVDELGEGMRPLASTLYNSAKEQAQPDQDGPKGEVPPEVKALNKYLISDTREAAEFVAAMKGQIFEDIKGVWSHLFPGSNVATLSKHPAIKWLSDRTLKHDRESRVQKENAKYGSVFAAKRGLLASEWNRRTKSDDGALTIFERMPIKEADEALTVWQDQFDGKMEITQEALDATTLNGTQKRAIMAANAQLKKFLDTYNQQAELHGFTKITPRPGYFPHLWDGDYRVKVKNADGDTVEVWGAKTQYEANTIAKDLQSQFPDYKVETGTAKSRYDLNDTSAFRETMGLLDSKDPLRQGLQRAYQEILARRGFQKQTLFREGKPGYLGSKVGKEGVKDSMRALELYLDRGYNFLANQKKRADFANMSKGLGGEGRLGVNAHNYMGAFIDHSTGGLKNQLEAIDNIIEMAGEKTGLGRSAGSNLLGGVNGTAAAMWLTTARFAVTQLVQQIYNLPKGIQLKGQGLTDKSVFATFTQANYEAFFKPSAETIAGMNWAKENGFIDSKILDLMGAKFDSKAKTIGTAFQTYSKYGLGKLEQEAVRTPSFIFYDMLLRDTIKDPKSRWEAAGMLTDKYMVDYTVTDSPLIYGHAGLLGDAARPLKQFSHAYAGQMLEYLQSAKHEKNIKPVAAFIGTQFLMSGLKGLMLAAEASAIIMVINQLFGSNIPTVDEWLASSNLSDTMVFGGVSTITGLDLSGSLGAPQIAQVATLPGVEFAVKGAKEVGNLAIQAAKGEETQADKMRALQAVTPNQLQGAVEESFTTPGEGPPNPNNRMIPNLDPRTDHDRLMRHMGGRSTKEARDMMQYRALDVKDALRKDQKNKAVNIVVDRIAQGKEPPKALIDRWVKLGGNPKELDEAILGQLKARAQSKAQRYLGSMKGLSGAQRAARLQEFNILLDQTTDWRSVGKAMKEMNNVNQ